MNNLNLLCKKINTNITKWYVYLPFWHQDIIWFWYLSNLPSRRSSAYMSKLSSRPSSGWLGMKSTFNPVFLSILVTRLKHKKCKPYCLQCTNDIPMSLYNTFLILWTISVLKRKRRFIVCLKLTVGSRQCRRNIVQGSLYHKYKHHYQSPEPGDYHHWGRMIRCDL